MYSDDIIISNLNQTRQTDTNISDLSKQQIVRQVNYFMNRRTPTVVFYDDYYNWDFSSYETISGYKMPFLNIENDRISNLVKIHDDMFFFLDIQAYTYYIKMIQKPDFYEVVISEEDIIPGYLMVETMF